MTDHRGCPGFQPSEAKFNPDDRWTESRKSVVIRETFSLDPMKDGFEKKMSCQIQKYSAVCLLVACFLLPNSVLAQNYSFTKDLFEKRSHDFGTVARAAQIDYVFEFTNNTENTIEISSVRTSCNCTTPTIVERTVKPGEKGGVKCKFNTRSFLGARRATVTVTFSRPYFSEVQLEVKGYVRRDIVVHPPAIDFKNVNEGAGATEKVSVEYAGDDSWKISEVKSSHPDIEVTLQETHRGNGLVGYELVANLKKSAEPGYLNNFQLMLKTNDNRLNEFPISISGKVEEAISISPDQIVASDVRAGETVSKRIILRGNEDFQIVGYQASDEQQVEVTLPEGEKKLHIITVKLQAGDQPGPFSGVLEFTTSQGGVKKKINYSGTVIE